jgi:hypothetical protein
MHRWRGRRRYLWVNMQATRRRRFLIREPLVGEAFSFYTGSKRRCAIDCFNAYTIIIREKRLANAF